MDVYEAARKYMKFETEFDRYNNYRRFLGSKKSSRKQGMRKANKRKKR